MHTSAHLARALCAIGSSDDMPTEIGAAIDTVAEHPGEQLSGILEQRDKAWQLLRKVANSA
jgi:hypothetical protein